MRYLLIVLFLPVMLAAQPFEFVQELDSIPAIVAGDTLPAAWTGGYGMTSPDLCDIDGDGDYDLMLGQSYNLNFWKNQGTPLQNNFVLIEPWLAGIDTTEGGYPKFVDIDNDTDLDLFIYTYSTGLKYYENYGSVTAPLFIMMEDTLRDILGNPIYGTSLDLADIDADGDYDLFIGQFYTGQIRFYENVGDSIQYAFALTSASFSGIIVGEGNPIFCDIDADNDLDLFIGDYAGKIHYYRNDGTSQNYNFTLISEQWLGINVAEDAEPEFCDIDGDGDYDLFIGKGNNDSYTVPGDLHFWRNVGTPQVPQMVQESQMYLTLDFEASTDLGILDVNLDTKGDPFVHANYVGWLKDTGTLTTPVYELQSYNVAGTGFLASSVGYGDLNGDNHDDMVVVYGWSGTVQFWLNNGDTLNPQFYFDDSFSIGLLAGGPCLADLDGDGDLDMIIGVDSYHFESFIYYYENQGNSQQYNFVLTSTNYQSWAGEYNVFTAFDADSDGDYDIIGTDTSYAEIYFENIGSPQNPVFAEPQIIFPPWTQERLGAPAAFCDVDNDGDWDAFGGSILGGILFFRNVYNQSPVDPRKRLVPTYPTIDLTLQPNPGNPVAIVLSLPAPQPATLAVYNLLGAKVATLTSGWQPAGQQRYFWETTPFASGVYLVRLEAGGESLAKKVVVVK